MNVVEVHSGSDFNGHRKIETVCTNNTVGYRPIRFHGPITRVATGSKFGMILCVCVSARKERGVWYGEFRVVDVRLHSCMGSHQVTFLPNRLSSMADAATQFTLVDGYKVNVHFHKSTRL